MHTPLVSLESGSFGVRIEEAIADIEGCNAIEELQHALQRIIEHYGFSSYSFIDAGQPHIDRPYYWTTTGKAWVNEYTQNGFISVDPALNRVRRTNTPFHWDDIELPQTLGRRKPGAVKTMEAARDHGFTEGYTIPFHFRDHRGFLFSSCTTFFWKDQVNRFNFLLRSHRHELHLIMIYWTQRAIDLVAQDYRQQAPFFRPSEHDGLVPLTDRERDVMCWAARGKTTIDTAEILHISTDTVETHVKHSLRKLNATNKNSRRRQVHRAGAD